MSSDCNTCIYDNIWSLLSIEEAIYILPIGRASTYVCVCVSLYICVCMCVCVCVYMCVCM